MIDALGELRVPLEASIYWLGALTHPWPHVKPHNAKVVMLIPGFMAGDMTLAPLANRKVAWTSPFSGPRTA